MKTTDKRRFLGVAAVVAGLLFMGSASAWYGGPWYRPYASGAVTYERQNMMRGHGYTMQELATMFEGRRMFNRDEAVRLARELESGFGDNLIRNYPPGAVVAGSRTLPSTWNNFGAFKGYAEASKQSAARLAEALEKEPTAQDVQKQGVWVPGPRMGYGDRRHRLEGLVSMEAIQEYSRLNATCHSCHMLFRGGRW